MGGTPKWMVFNGKSSWNGWSGSPTISGNCHILEPCTARNQFPSKSLPHDPSPRVTVTIRHIDRLCVFFCWDHQEKTASARAPGFDPDWGIEFPKFHGPEAKLCGWKFGKVGQVWVSFPSKMSSKITAMMRHWWPAFPLPEASLMGATIVSMGWIKGKASRFSLRPVLR